MYLQPLPDGADERCKKDAIFHLFLNIWPSNYKKLKKKIVKYRFNQVKGFPKWYHSSKSLKKLKELTLFGREWLKKAKNGGKNSKIADPFRKIILKW